MATDELQREAAEASSSTTLPIRSSENDATGSSNSEERPKDIIPLYHHLLATDPEITKPVAAIEAIVSHLRLSPTSTAMETVETVKKQATILQRGVADPLPVKAGADILKAFLDQTLKQPTAPPPALPRGQALDSFEQARTHLLASSRLFTGRARTARAAIAERAAREAGPGATVLTGCGSRCVRDALLRAAALQTRDLGCPQFKVVYATHAAAPPARDAAAVAALRAAGVFVAEVDWRMVPAALEAAGVRKVLVGASAVTHDGNVLAGAGTYLLAQLARAAGAQLVVLAELHKFVLEHTLNNAGLRDGGLRQEVLDFRSAEEPLAEPLAEPVLPVSEQVDWTPKELITSIITEKRKMPPNLAYQIILDRR